MIGGWYNRLHIKIVSQHIQFEPSRHPINMKKHHGPVAFVSVSDLIRDKSLSYNENLPIETSQPVVISTSFMAADSENVKDSHGDDLDCFDEDCDFSPPAGWRVNPTNKTIINSSQTATSQFSENSSLRQQPLLACQLTLGGTKSPRPQSLVRFFLVIYSQQICGSPSQNC